MGNKSLYSTHYTKSIYTTPIYSIYPYRNLLTIEEERKNLKSVYVITILFYNTNFDFEKYYLISTKLLSTKNLLILEKRLEMTVLEIKKVLEENLIYSNYLSIFASDDIEIKLISFLDDLCIKNKNENFYKSKDHHHIRSIDQKNNDFNMNMRISESNTQKVFRYDDFNYYPSHFGNKLKYNAELRDEERIKKMIKIVEDKTENLRIGRLMLKRNNKAKKSKNVFNDSKYYIIENLDNNVNYGDDKMKSDVEKYNYDKFLIENEECKKYEDEFKEKVLTKSSTKLDYIQKNKYLDCSADLDSINKRKSKTIKKIKIINEDIKSPKDNIDNIKKDLILCNNNKKEISSNNCNVKINISDPKENSNKVIFKSHKKNNYNKTKNIKESYLGMDSNNREEKYYIIKSLKTIQVDGNTQRKFIYLTDNISKDNKNIKLNDSLKKINDEINKKNKVHVIRKLYDTEKYEIKKIID